VGRGLSAFAGEPRDFCPRAVSHLLLSGLKVRHFRLCSLNGIHPTHRHKAADVNGIGALVSRGYHYCDDVIFQVVRILYITVTVVDVRVSLIV